MAVFAEAVTRIEVKSCGEHDLAEPTDERFQRGGMHKGGSPSLMCALGSTFRRITEGAKEKPVPGVHIHHSKL